MPDRPRPGTIGQRFPNQRFFVFWNQLLRNRIGQNCPIAPARALKIPKAKNRTERACFVTEPRLQGAVAQTSSRGEDTTERRSLESHVEEQDAEVGQTSRSEAGVHAGLSSAPNRPPDLEVRRGSGDPHHQRRRDIHLYGWPGGPWRLLSVAAPSDGRGSVTRVAAQQDLNNEAGSPFDEGKPASLANCQAAGLDGSILIRTSTSKRAGCCARPDCLAPGPCRSRRPCSARSEWGC